MEQYEVLNAALNVIEGAFTAPRPIKTRPIDASDPVVLRHLYEVRAGELEAALRGMVGLVVLLNTNNRLASNPTKHPRFLAAVEALK